MKIQDYKEKIKHTVRRMCEENGVTVKKEYESTTESFPDSLSMYFYLNFNGIKKTIRVSDHKYQHVHQGQTKLISSITITKSTKFDHVKRFIANRIKEIKATSLCVRLDKLSLAA